MMTRKVTKVAGAAGVVACLFCDHTDSLLRFHPKYKPAGREHLCATVLTCPECGGVFAPRNEGNGNGAGSR